VRGKGEMVRGGEMVRALSTRVFFFVIMRSLFLGTKSLKQR